MNLAFKKFVIVLITVSLLPKVAFSEDDQSSGGGGGQSSGMLVGIAGMVGGTIAAGIKISTESQISAIAAKTDQEIFSLNAMAQQNINRFQNEFARIEMETARKQKLADIKLRSENQFLENQRIRAEKLYYENEDFKNRQDRREEKRNKMMLALFEQRSKTLIENMLTSRRYSQSGLYAAAVDPNPGLTTQVTSANSISVSNGLSVSRFPNSTQLLETGRVSGLTNKIVTGSTSSDLNTFTTTVASKTAPKQQGLIRHAITQNEPANTPSGTHSGTH
jgi:hypothetical protein